MKPIHLIFLVLFLLGQWVCIEHDYHEHAGDEVCETCISLKNLKDFDSSSCRVVVSSVFHSYNIEPAIRSIDVPLARLFAVRAPPVFS